MQLTNNPKIKKFVSGFLFLISGTIVILQSSCVSYLAHVAHGQWQIMRDNVPVKEAILNPAKYKLSSNEVERLKQSIQIVAFAKNELKFKIGKNYQNFKKLNRNAIAYQVSASEKFQLKPVTWYFPIAGRVPYLGFFTIHKQKQKEKELTEKGYDVRLQNVIGYSTLGWFNDPILSPQLKLPLTDFINLILHELAHATIYFPGDTNFNESVATFLGDEGTKQYLKMYYGETSKEYTNYLNELTERKIFSAHIKKCILQLEALYQSKIEPEQMQIEKNKIIEQSKSEWAALISKMPVSRYKGYASPQFKPNNAHYLSFKRYFLDFSVFEESYQYFNQDMQKFITYLHTLKKRGKSIARKSHKNKSKSIHGLTEDRLQHSIYVEIMRADLKKWKNDH